MGRSSIDFEGAMIGGSVAAAISFVVAAAAAFVTHVMWIFSILMNDSAVSTGKAIIAILGVVFPPIGCMHGVWLWFH